MHRTQINTKIKRENKRDKTEDKNSVKDYMLQQKCSLSNDSFNLKHNMS